MVAHIRSSSLKKSDMFSYMVDGLCDNDKLLVSADELDDFRTLRGLGGDGTCCRWCLRVDLFCSFFFRKKPSIPRLCLLSGVSSSLSGEPGEAANGVGGPLDVGQCSGLEDGDGATAVVTRARSGDGGYETVRTALDGLPVKGRLANSFSANRKSSKQCNSAMRFRSPPVEGRRVSNVEIKDRSKKYK